MISPTPSPPPTATPTLSAREWVLRLAGEEGVRLAQDAQLLRFQDEALQTPAAHVPLRAGTHVQLTARQAMPHPQNAAMTLREVRVMDGDFQGQVGWLPQDVLEAAEPLTPLVVCQVADGCHVRAGDGTHYPVVIGLSNGETARVRGVSSTGSGWLAITTGGGVQGWVAPFVVTQLGDLRSVPALVPPPSPTPSDTPPPPTPTAPDGSA